MIMRRFPSPSRNQVVSKLSLRCFASARWKHGFLDDFWLYWFQHWSERDRPWARRVPLTASDALVKFSFGNIDLDLSIDISGRCSSMAE